VLLAFVITFLICSHIIAQWFEGTRLSQQVLQIQTG
jgi:hypothetical protein